jgi:seryl-tRNA synthetase|tara:strand:- start:1932 stop:3203 length:1272 start_codon:yes stop_codon:yes gene_type:complete
MLSLSFIRNNRDLIIERLNKRNFDSKKLVDKIIKFDLERRKIIAVLEEKQAKGNLIAKKISELYKFGKNIEAEKLKLESKDLKADSKKNQQNLSKIENDILELRISIPNIPDKTVPDGNSEIDNQEVFRSKKITNLPSTAKSHWELSKKYDIIDFDLGSKISGTGFPVYKNKGARLQRGLINFFLEENISAGYKEYQVPYLANSDSAFATGQLPDKDAQMYNCEQDNLYLIPTAEVPLTNLYRNTLLIESELPICLTGYTPCFRREAGSYGSDVRGLNRLHQFDKVEIVRLETQENGKLALDQMIEHVKKILEKLDLPYRILKLCSGDLGFTSSITYDFEVFSAAQKKWLEVSSVSIFNDFQSERLNLKYKTKTGEKKSVYTLNGSSLALPRIVASIIENFQTNDGIIIPRILVPYTGFKLID